MKRFLVPCMLVISSLAISACQQSEILPMEFVTTMLDSDEMPDDRSNATVEMEAMQNVSPVSAQTEVPDEIVEANLSEILPLIIENEEKPFTEDDLIVGKHKYKANLYDVLLDTGDPEKTEMWTEGASGDVFLALYFENGDQYTFHVGKDSVALHSVNIQSDFVTGARGIKVGDSIASVLTAFRISDRDAIGDDLRYHRSEPSIVLYHTEYSFMNEEGIEEIHYDEPAGVLKPNIEHDTYEANLPNKIIEYAFPFDDDYAKTVQEENTSFVTHGSMRIEFDEEDHVAAWYWDVHAYAE